MIATSPKPEAMSITCLPMRVVEQVAGQRRPPAQANAQNGGLKDRLARPPDPRRHKLIRITGLGHLDREPAARAEAGCQPG